MRKILHAVEFSPKQHQPQLKSTIPHVEVRTKEHRQQSCSTTIRFEQHMQDMAIHCESLRSSIPGGVLACVICGSTR